MQPGSLTYPFGPVKTLLTRPATCGDVTSQAVQFLHVLRQKIFSVSFKAKFMHQQSNISSRVITSQALAKLIKQSGEKTAFAEQSSVMSRSVIEGFARIFEIILIFAIGALLWVSYVAEFTATSVLQFLPVLGFVGFGLPFAMQMSQLFRIPAYLGVMRSISKLAVIWLGVFAIVFAFVFFTKIGADYSRIWLGGWAIGSFVAVVMFRAGMASYLQKRTLAGDLSRRAVLVGGGEPAEKLLAAFEATPAQDVSLIGIFDDRGDDRSPESIGKLAKLGTIDELVEFSRQTRVDILIVTLPVTAEVRLLQIIKRLSVLPVDIRLSAYSQKLRYRSRAYSYLGNIPMLDILDKPLAGWGGLIKNIEDKTIAALSLVVLSPVLALVALAVKLESPGPVLFRQKRYGFNNEMIEVLKFRSMYVDQCDAKATKLVTKNDPRVTRVGRFIRKTSLDELPQIFNVLRGDLSLVGPRPHATQAKAQNDLYYDVVDDYFSRHRVKPGVTGWAQINGWRGETDTREKIERRVEHDLYYIENWSFLFDMYILAKTPFSLIETENAY